MVEEIKNDVRARTLGYVSAALGLVAGLAWNDAIKAMIETLFPVARNTVAVKFFYAILVTMAVIILIRSLDKFLHQPRPEGSLTK